MTGPGGVAKPGAPVVPLIALAAGSVLTWAHAWVLDDAFIYFRYADNASLLGAGLVFNQGEYIEGYTSPLWMLLLVLVRALGLPYWPVLVILGLAGMVATWALAIRVNRLLSGDQPLELHLPALWLSSCYAVQSHFTSGLETPMVQVVALAFAALVLQPGAVWLQVLVGLGPLVRPELNLAFVVAVVWGWHRRRRVPWTLLAVGLATQGAWLVFRLTYYADLVPNTFHLKDTAAAVRGLRYLHDTLRAYYLYPILGGLLLLLGLARARGQGGLQLGPRAVLWLTATAHAAYVVKIGGDFVHYRYLAFPVLVLVASLGGVVERLIGAPSRPRVWGARAFALAFTALVVLAYPAAQLPAHPLLLWPHGDTLQMYRTAGVEDAAAHRGRMDLAPGSWGRSPSEVKTALRDGKLRYVWVGESGWCRAAYEHLDWYVVQSFGLTDPVLAHVIDPIRESQAGHRWRIVPLARDLARLRMSALGVRPSLAAPRGESVYRRAVRLNEAPPWVIRNLRALEEIERRTHGAGTPWANAVSAFRPWPRLVVTPADIAAATGP